MNGPQMTNNSSSSSSINGPPLLNNGSPSVPGIRGPLTIINKELPPEPLRPRVMLSFMKNKEEVERVSYYFSIIFICGEYTRLTHRV